MAHHDRDVILAHDIALAVGEEYTAALLEMVPNNVTHLAQALFT